MTEFVKDLALTAGGGTYNLNASDPASLYVVSGSATLASSWTIAAAGTPYEGQLLKVRYLADIDLDGNNITVFGTALTQAQAKSILDISALYNGATWEVSIDLVFPVSNTYPGTEATTLTTSGGFITLQSGLNKRFQYFDGAGVLLSSYTISASNTDAKDGDEFICQFRSAFDLNGNTITLFGYSLSQYEITKGCITTISVYDEANTTWNTVVIREASALPTTYEGATQVTITNAGGSITMTPGESKQFLQLVGGTTLTGSYTVTAGTGVADGDEFWIDYAGTIALGGFNITVFGYTLSEAEAANGNIAFYCKYDQGNATWRVVKMAKNGGSILGAYEVVVVPLSFETGEQCANPVVVPYDFEIIEINATVTKAIAGTDSATVAVDIDGTPTNPASGAFSASDPLGTLITITMVSANTGTAGQTINLTTSKTTAGGKALASIKLQRK